MAAAGHRGRAPVFDVAADPAHRAHDILLGAGERAAQFAREAEPRDSKHLVDPFQDRSGNAVPVPFEGACSGCPSSTATLRQGIQNLLKHFLPDVQAVEQIEG